MDRMQITMDRIVCENIQLKDNINIKSYADAIKQNASQASTCTQTESVNPAGNATNHKSPSVVSNVAPDQTQFRNDNYNQNYSGQNQEETELMRPIIDHVSHVISKHELRGRGRGRVAGRGRGREMGRGRGFVPHNPTAPHDTPNFLRLAIHQSMSRDNSLHCAPSYSSLVSRVASHDSESHKEERGTRNKIGRASCRERV